MRFHLEPDVDIEHGSGPAADPVWFRVEPTARIPRGRWVRFRYSSNLFDRNARPLLRLGLAGGGYHVQPMNGTLMGVGEWLGWIPGDCSTIAISPGGAPDPSGFRIDGIRSVAASHVWLRIAYADPHFISWAMRRRKEVTPWEMERNLKVRVDWTPVGAYDRWLGARSRRLDMEDLDRPATDWGGGPALRLLMNVAQGDVPGLRNTLRSLSSQVYSRWSLHVLVDPDSSEAHREAVRGVLADEPRASEVATSTTLAELGTDAGASTFCACLYAGDVLPDYALGVIVEALARRPGLMAIYGDEDSISASGALHSPVLRPDWSPILQAARPYLGPMTCVRSDALAGAGLHDAGGFFAAAPAGFGAVLDRLDRASICHVRRVLYRRRREKPMPDPRRGQTSPATRPIASEAVPDVEVIVPSRDNPDCLAKCIEGLTTGTDYPNLHVTVVDNGSREDRALALLKELGRHPRIRILERPGPFNFSALCNGAAKETAAPMLLFLNDDVEIIERTWLQPLVALALRPDVGAVGSKLLYGGGSIQHVGVVLGLRGTGAGHRYHGQNPASPGYLDQLQVPHEVGAVTGACLAVERWKFESVGGFDAERLPVEWNDIDLCLRLAERGYGSVWTPDSVLIHHESTSRGTLPASEVRYRAERTYFLSRWHEAVRDDPYFHPDLSLFAKTSGLA